MRLGGLGAWGGRLFKDIGCHLVSSVHRFPGHALLFVGNGGFIYQLDSMWERCRLVANNLNQLRAVVIGSQHPLGERYPILSDEFEKDAQSTFSSYFNGRDKPFKDRMMVVFYSVVFFSWRTV